MKPKPIIAALLAIVALGLTAIAARAEAIKLTWDPYTALLPPGITINFRIEQERSAPWGDAGVWKTVATGVAAAPVVLPEISAGPVNFRAFAYYKEKPEVESLPSAVLATKADLPPPAGLQKVTVALQVSTDLKTWRDVAVVEKDLEEKEFFRTSAVVSTPGK